MSAVLSHIRLSKPELKLWLYTFTALCLIFSPLIFQFIWGNHDWQPLLVDSRLNSGLIEGRFSQYFLLCLLLMGKILPILNILLGFVLYALALTLLYSRYFDFKIARETTLIIITAAILPYINEIIYFQFIVFSQLSWPLFIVLSLLAVKKAGQSKKIISLTFLSFLILLFTIGGYPASANLFVCAAVLEFIKQRPYLKQFPRLVLPYAISLACAFLSLYLIQTWLIDHNMMINLYNNHTPTIKELLFKIGPTIGLSLQSLIQPQPFFSVGLKILTCAVILLFFCHELLTRTSLYQKATFIILFILLLLCLKFSAWLIVETPDDYFAIHDPAAFMVRTDFYAIPCLVLFCLSILVNTSNKACKNFAVLTSVLLMIISSNADFNFTKVHLFGFKTEALLQQRINNRIQEHPAYNPAQQYTIIQAGEQPARPRYYQKGKFEKYGFYTLQIPYTRHWIAFEYYNFYEPFPFVREGTFINPEDMSANMINFLSKIDIWPSQNAVYVDDKYGIIVLSPEGKEMLSSQFQIIKEAL